MLHLDETVAFQISDFLSRREVKIASRHDHKDGGSIVKVNFTSDWWNILIQNIKIKSLITSLRIEIIES